MKVKGEAKWPYSALLRRPCSFARIIHLRYHQVSGGWRICRVVVVDISTEKQMNRMRMACVCGLAVVLCLAMRGLGADAPPQGFEALFDGKDLSNFKASDEQKKHWIIKDNGVLEFSPVG